MTAACDPIRIGVSSCLLGEHVRYDGGHKHDRYITDTLGRFFRFLPVCPEVDCGMPIPREAMRLEGDPENPRLMTQRSRIDKTDRMLAFCKDKVRELERADLSGFIFKKGSPSSGLFRVKVYGPSGIPAKNGSGLFAAAVARHFSLLPMEEEGRLNNPAIRVNFIERVFCYRRWKDFLLGVPVLEPHPAELVLRNTGRSLFIRSLFTPLPAIRKLPPLEDLLTLFAEVILPLLIIGAVMYRYSPESARKYSGSGREARSDYNPLFY